jgi:hypothetical protein
MTSAAVCILATLFCANAFGDTWDCVGADGLANCRVENMVARLDGQSVLGQGNYIKVDLERDDNGSDACQTALFAQSANISMEELKQIQAILTVALVSGKRIKFSVVGKYGNKGCVAESVLIQN